MKTYTSPKTLRRRFLLQIAVPSRFGWVEDVIDGIEQEELLVFRPDDPKPFADERDQDGIIIINSRARLPIRIREWLPVACQVVRPYDPVQDGEEKEKVAAFYNSNINSVMLPQSGDYKPPGPAAFHGEIVLHLTPRFLSDEMELPFKFVIAHELVHALDNLIVLAPAVLDWKGFWKGALNEGSACDLAKSALHEQAVFAERYGTEIELAAVERFWPSKARSWFDAYYAAGEEEE